MAASSSTITSTNEPQCQPWHPGLPSIEMAQNDYNQFYSDHVPVLFTGNVRGMPLSIVSWNVMEGDSYNGVAPLGQSSYGESPEQRSARYERIADAISRMLQTQRPDFFTLQEIRAYLPADDGSLGILPDGLWAAIAGRLAGTPYAAATYNGSIIDTAGNITLYNQEKFDFDEQGTPLPQGHRPPASLPRQYNQLGAHAVSFVTRGTEEDAPRRIKICNVHADYSDIPTNHESMIRSFISEAHEADSGAAVVGDFNCNALQPNSHEQTIVTSAAPSIFRNGQIQGACAIDAAYYGNEAGQCEMPLLAHLDVRTGNPIPAGELVISEDTAGSMPQLQQNELRRFRLAMCPQGNPYHEAQARLDETFGKGFIRVMPAINMQNRSTMALVIGRHIYRDSLLTQLQGRGLQDSQIDDQHAGTAYRVVYLPQDSEQQSEVINEILQHYASQQHVQTGLQSAIKPETISGPTPSFVRNNAFTLAGGLSGIAGPALLAVGLLTIFPPAGLGLAGVIGIITAVAVVGGVIGVTAGRLIDNKRSEDTLTSHGKMSSLMPGTKSSPEGSVISGQRPVNTESPLNAQSGTTQNTSNKGISTPEKDRETPRPY